MNTAGRIMVVDDDKTTVSLLEHTLTPHGYEVHAAFDGDEALHLYKQVKPDLIILDILMPKMDGYTFVQEFKKIGDLRQTPIIILSCQGHLQDIFAIEGINDYIVKPFVPEQLLKKVAKRLKNKTKKIMIVDDAVDNVSIMEESLTNRGYDIITAFDGLDGFEKAKRERPDLLLLDVMIPKLNGYNLCRMLKFDPNYKEMGVVFLSARGEAPDQKIGFDVGGDAYLTKPLNGDLLLDTLKKLLWD
jgi:DNA-binding response OmpR family regulator